MTYILHMLTVSWSEFRIDSLNLCVFQLLHYALVWTHKKIMTFDNVKRLYTINQQILTLFNKLLCNYQLKWKKFNFLEETNI